MPNLLNTSTMMMCPHGGTVQIISSNTRAKAGGDFLARKSDQFIIAGCAFVTPAGVPHPCMRVDWKVTTQHDKAAGDDALNEQSIGLCVAGDQAVQGMVQITFTQPRVAGS